MSSGRMEEFFVAFESLLELASSIISVVIKIMIVSWQAADAPGTHLSLKVTWSHSIHWSSTNG
jgi:hypothetical protein